MSNEKTKEQANKIMTEKAKELFIVHSIDSEGIKHVTLTSDDLRWFTLAVGLVMFALGRLSAF